MNAEQDIDPLQKLEHLIDRANVGMSKMNAWISMKRKPSVLWLLFTMEHPRLVDPMGGWNPAIRLLDSSTARNL